MEQNNYIQAIDKQFFLLLISLYYKMIVFLIHALLYKSRMYNYCMDMNLNMIILHTLYYVTNILCNDRKA